jgi:hypothetical protein
MHALLLALAISATGQVDIRTHATIQIDTLNTASVVLLEQVVLSDGCVDLNSRLGLTGSDVCGLQDIAEVSFRLGPATETPRRAFMHLKALFDGDADVDGELIRVPREEIVRKELTIGNAAKVVQIVDGQLCGKFRSVIGVTQCSSVDFHHVKITHKKQGGWKLNKALKEIVGLWRVVRGRP